MVEEAGLEIESELQLRSDCGDHIYIADSSLNSTPHTKVVKSWLAWRISDKSLLTHTATIDRDHVFI